MELLDKAVAKAECLSKLYGYDVNALLGIGYMSASDSYHALCSGLGKTLRQDQMQPVLYGYMKSLMAKAIDCRQKLIEWLMKHASHNEMMLEINRQTLETYQKQLDNIQRMINA